jgi:hypothetical protein
LLSAVCFLLSAVGCLLYIYDLIKLCDSDNQIILKNLHSRDPLPLMCSAP